MLPNILEIKKIKIKKIKIRKQTHPDVDIAEKETERFTTGLSIEEIAPFDKELSKQSKWM